MIQAAPQPKRHVRLTVHVSNNHGSAFDKLMPKRPPSLFLSWRHGSPSSNGAVARRTTAAFALRDSAWFYQAFPTATSFACQ